MKQEALRYFSDTHLTEIAMIIFMVTFLGLFINVILRSQQPHFEKMSKLPLEEKES